MGRFTKGSGAFWGVVAAGLVTASVTVSGAASGPALGAGLDVGLTGFADIVADEAHGRLFISQGTDTVVVTDLDGTPAATVTGLQGASDMALSQDAGTLWVAMTDGDGIAAVDTSTLEAVTYPIGVAPCGVAVSSGLVWFGYPWSPVPGGWIGQIGALDPSNGSVTLHLASGFSPGPDLRIASSPARADTLVVAPNAGALPALLVYETAAENPPTLKLTASGGGSLSVVDLALTPDGSQVVTAPASLSEHRVFKVSDLSLAGSYPTAYQPDAVAISGDGMVAAGGGGYILVFRPGSTTPYNTYHQGSVGRGLAMADRTIFAVTPAELQLQVITVRGASTVTVATDMASYDYNQVAKVTVTLTGGETNREVSVYATPYARSRTLVGSGTVDSNGRLTLGVRVKQRTTFEAVYDGDENYDPATANAVVVKVAAQVKPWMSGYQRRSGRYYVYTPKHAAVNWAQVYPNHAGDCLAFRLQFKVRGHWRTVATLGCVRLNGTSKAAAGLDWQRELIGIPMRFRAEWKGDAENLKKTSPWRYAKFVKTASGARSLLQREVGPVGDWVAFDAVAAPR